MKKLFTIIMKNFKVLARSKSSSLIVFFGPLLVILIVGLSFSNSQSFNLKLGSYSSSYSELSENMISQLRDNNYRIQKFASESLCIEGIKQGAVNGCIIFPADMKVTAQSQEIRVHIDNSKINLVYVLIDSMTQKISSTSENISLDLTSDLISKLNFAQTQSSDNLITLNEIVGEEKSMKNRADSVKTNMNELDTQFNKDDFKQNDINKNLGLIQEQLSIINLQISRLSNAKNKIEPVSTKIEPSFFNESKELDDSVSIIKSAKSNLSSTSIEMSTKISDLSSAVTSLNFILEQTKDKLADVELKKTYTMDAMEKMKSALLKIEINLGELKKSSNDISSKINSIEVKNAGAIVTPIKTKIEPISVEKSHFNFLFPTLIVLIVMITAILYSATATVVERNSKSYFRNMISPSPKYLFSIGQFIASLIMIVSQVVLFSLFAIIFFKQYFFASILETFLAIILISSMFILFGMLIGTIFNTEETAILASISVSSLFLFLSNTVIAIESLPEMVGQIVQFNPFVISETILRQTIIYKLGITKLATPLFLLVDFIILLTITIFLIKKARKI